MMNAQYDVIVVGGGLAGSSLSIALARRGVDVLLLEAETRFRDRVRGEALYPWGVTEARKLGLYDLLIASGARSLPYRDTYVGGELRSRQEFAQEANNGEPFLSFTHARVQEALIQAAAEAGATVVRGARVKDLQTGRDPRVEFEVEGNIESAAARLVVGADGRSSRVRALAGFEIQRGATGLLTAGVALQGLAVDEEAVPVAFDPRAGESASLLPQGDGRARAYFTFRPGEAADRALREVPRLVERMIATGLPPSIAAATAAGPLATFDGTPKWVEFPYRDGVALIGDAASAPDPAWGQGMSATLRDVSVLADAFLTEPSVSDAGRVYGSEHARYTGVIRVVSRLLSQGVYEDDEAARALRASELWKSSYGRLKAVPLSGPDIDLQEFLSPCAIASAEGDPEASEPLAESISC